MCLTCHVHFLQRLCQCMFIQLCVQCGGHHSCCCCCTRLHYTVQMFLLLCPSPVNLRVTQVTADPLTPLFPSMRLLQGIGFAEHASANWLALPKSVLYLNTHSETRITDYLCVWRGGGCFERTRQIENKGASKFTHMV